MPEPSRPVLSSSLSYRDPLPMLDWLERAFGFERAMVITDADGRLAHSELRFDEGLIMVGGEWSEDHASPASLGGKNTQSVHIQLRTDLDAHCERARAVGAAIVQEPATQFYGDRTYRAKDPEGHVWTFSRTVEVVTPEAWDRASGLTTTIFE